MANAVTLSKVPVTPPRSPHPKPTLVPAHNKIILIVEDEEPVRRVLQKLLEVKGFRVATAKDGLDGMKYLEDNVPDLMIIDIMMPRLDGLAFAKAVRYRSEKQKSLPKIPFIFLTAKSDARSMIQGINAGAKSYISKPFTVDLVIRKIHEALGIVPPSNPNPAPSAVR